MSNPLFKNRAVRWLLPVQFGAAQSLSLVSPA